MIEPREDFPMHILPGWAGDYVTSLAHVLQVEPCVPALAVLGAVATAVQGKAELHVRGGWDEQLAFWCFVALRSGNRKTPALTKPLGPLFRHQKAENERRDTYRKAIEEAMERIPPRAADAKSRRKALEEALPPRCEMVATDTTPEALVLMLSEQNESVTLATDEPTSIAQIMAGLYSERGGANLGIFMAGYSGSPYVRKRVKSASASLEHPALSLLLFGQPRVLDDLAGRENLIELGFVGRLLLVRPPDRLGDRAVHADEVPEPVRDAYYQGVETVLAAPWRTGLPDTRQTWVEDPPPWPQGPVPRFRLQMTEAACAAHMDFERELEPMLQEHEALGDLSDFGGKLAGQVARVAGLVHVLDHPEAWWQEPVDELAMAAGIEVGRYALGQVLGLYSERARERATEEMAEQVHAKAKALVNGHPAGQRFVTWRQLYRRCVAGNGRGKIRTKETLRDVVEELEESGRLTRDPHWKRGERWLVG